MKVVINGSHGGFGLSKKAIRLYREKTGLPLKNDGKLERNDPTLVEVVEELGDKANDGYSCLKIIEIPDGVEFVIQEHAGIEWVAEKHRTWGTD